jgi:hypothetical protein
MDAVSEANPTTTPRFKAQLKRIVIAMLELLCTNDCHGFDELVGFTKATPIIALQNEQRPLRIGLGAQNIKSLLSSRLNAHVTQVSRPYCPRETEPNGRTFEVSGALGGQGIIIRYLIYPLGGLTRRIS